MSAALALPLVPAALVAGSLALLDAAAPPVGVGAGLLGALLLGALALASADRPRRLLWWAAAATAAVLALRPLVELTSSFDLRDLPPLAAMRAALAAPLVRLIPEPEAGLVLGIVLGERTTIGAGLLAAFNATGTTHLLAISGYNLTLVGAGVALVARRLAPTPRTLLSLVVIYAYCLIVGLQPSVLRAALMATVGTVAVATGRRAAAANALAAAVVVMLALDPAGLGQAGFLLSVGATAGLIAWQRPLAARLRRLPVFVGESLAATLAASLPTLPIIAAVFGRISLVAPAANLVAVPLFAPLLGAGALAGLAGSLSLDAAGPFALAAYAAAHLLRQAVESFASLPGAAVEVPEGAATGAAVTLLLAAALLVGRTLRLGPPVSGLRARLHRTLASAGRPPRDLRRSVAVACAAASLVAVVAAIVLTRPPDPRVRVYALDVGQGDGFLVDVDGRLALIDGGPDPQRTLAELGAVLPPWRRRIDLLALTHAHLDHGAGLLAVLDRYAVGLAIEPVGLNEGPLATDWAARAARAGVPRRAVRAGERVRLGAAVFDVLSPEADPRVDIPSLALRLRLERFTMLFMGDLVEQAQADLLLRPDALATRVYVPPHHGAATPHAAALVAAVRPEAAILSVGALNRYGHPAPSTLVALGAVPTYRTDRDGTVEIRSDGTDVDITTHANALPPPRRGSLPYAPEAR